METITCTQIILGVTILISLVFSPILLSSSPVETSIKDTLFLSIISQNDITNSFFDTTAQVLATILAIVFSISLFVIEMNSERYSQKIKKYYGDTLFTRSTFPVGLLTIFICISFIIFNVKDYFLGETILLLVILNFLLLFNYYLHMKKIIDPENIAELLGNDCIEAALKGQKETFEDLVASIADMIIKSIERKDAALRQKYIQTIRRVISEIIGSEIEVKEKNNLLEFAFTEVERARRYSIDQQDDSRIGLSAIIFMAIYLEVNS